MTIDDYVFAAVVSHISWQQIASGPPYKKTQLASRLSELIGVAVPKDKISTAISQMARHNFVEIIETGLTEPYLKLNYKPINEYVIAKVTDQKSPEYVYRRVGKELLLEVFGENGANDGSSGEEVLEPPPSLNETQRVRLVSELELVSQRLDEENLSNEVKAQALAFVRAAKTLAEAPEPPVEMVWDLICKASQLAGIASLFVAVFALFGH